MLQVIVMVGGTSIMEQRTFKSEARAIRFASKMQDRGYKVRVIDL